MILTAATVASGCDELMTVLLVFHGVADLFYCFATFVSRKPVFVIAL